MPMEQAVYLFDMELIREGGRETLRANDDVVPTVELRRLAKRARDLERPFGLVLSRMVRDFFGQPDEQIAFALRST
jgi:hypothetical protein